MLAGNIFRVEECVVSIKHFWSVAVVAIACTGPAWAQGLREASTPQERQRVQKALDEQGIRAAAAVYGKYVQEEAVAPQGVAANVRVLASQSDVVAVGRILANVSSVTADGRGISTEYRVVIQRLFKGPSGLRQGDILDVTLPGGYVAFPDGSSATGVTRDLRQMDSNKIYLLFLTPSRDPAPAEVASGVGPFGRYRLTMGGQGVYEVDTPSAEGAVMPLGNSNTPVAYELFRLKTSEAALTRVQQAVDSLPPEADNKRP